MKRVRETVVVGFVAAAILAIPALTFAVINPPINPLAGFDGPVVIKYTNFDEGTVYLVPGGPPPAGTEYGIHGGAGIPILNGLPQTGIIPPAAAPTDSWGIFRIDTITDTTGTIDIYNRFSFPYEITGIFWGSQDSYLKVTDGGLPTEQQETHGVGMHAAFFTDFTKNWNPAGGPLAVGSWAGGLPVYPTATDGNLLWTVNSVPGWLLGDPDEFFSFFRPQGNGPGAASSNGGFVADAGAVPFWGTGGFNSTIIDSVGADMEINFTADTVGAFTWLLHSDDPIRLQRNASIPEPISAGLSLLGLAGLGLIASRRRTA